MQQDLNKWVILNIFTFLKWAGYVQHLLWYFKGRSESGCHTHMVKTPPSCFTVPAYYLCEPPRWSISGPSTAMQKALASAMSYFMRPSPSKAWLWISCNMTSWFGNPCLQRSVLLASSSLALEHHQVPSSQSLTSIRPLPVSASLDDVYLNMLSAGQNMWSGLVVLA